MYPTTPCGSSSPHDREDRASVDPPISRSTAVRRRVQRLHAGLRGRVLRPRHPAEPGYRTEAGRGPWTPGVNGIGGAVDSTTATAWTPGVNGVDSWSHQTRSLREKRTRSPSGTAHRLHRAAAEAEPSSPQSSSLDGQVVTAGSGVDLASGVGVGGDHGLEETAVAVLLGGPPKGDGPSIVDVGGDHTRGAANGDDPPPRPLPGLWSTTPTRNGRCRCRTLHNQFNDEVCVRCGTTVDALEGYFIGPRGEKEVYCRRCHEDPDWREGRSGRRSSTLGLRPEPKPKPNEQRSRRRSRRHRTT